MKSCILILLCTIGVIYASEVIHASLEAQFDESQREDCVPLEGECTNNRKGCCPSTGYSEIGCQCYVLKKDKKRYNTVGPATTKCWCERTGYWWEKVADSLG
ncbi:latartoxin-1b-like [Argiope bruennichi]|uniref:Uncharacterized protein n=1 Tax=Argiope bruennichi TaxID=94029 RepID=A0A8T0E6Z6_ARGBR|nr:latartoxin-1b-like [Argiope bruennichi]KAF8764964.1 hypothetical protein HNY73_022987 [Argiope bruennichi]